MSRLVLLGLLLTFATDAGTPESFAAAKDQFLQADFKAAAKTFRALADSDPANSELALWVGRTYDRWADVANPLRTRPYALLARRYFERAVALDPTNREALRELLHSYLDATRFGSTDWQRASAIAERISGLKVEEGRSAADLLRIRRREFRSAEEIFVHTIQAPSDAAGRLLRTE
jgi:hypothetical protein